MSAGWSGGSTRAWRRLRALVLLRDTTAGWGCRAHEEHTAGRSWCEIGGAGRHACDHVGQTAHHTRGKRAGDNPADLVAACTVCNLAIGEPNAGRTDPPATPVTNWR